MCTPCAAGTYAASSGAVVCLPCPSCDDGDACTTDTCDPVLACTHVPSASCNDAGLDAGPAAVDAGSDAGASDGGGADAGSASDAGPSNDAATAHDGGAATDAGHDAGARDGSTTDASTSGIDSGTAPSPAPSCGCRVGSPASTGWSGALGIAAALALASRRRYRAR